MPWTGKTFRERHGLKLTPKQSARAAQIANAILKDSGDEGLAIATALSLVKHKPKKMKKRG